MGGQQHSNIIDSKTHHSLASILNQDYHPQIKAQLQSIGESPPSLKTAAT